MNKQQQPRQSRWRFVRRGIGLIGLVLIGGIVYLAYLKPLPGTEKTPAGVPRNSTVAIPMRDGITIAADVWLPADLQPGQQVPTIIETTRYWRTTGMGPLYRFMVNADQDVMPGLAEAEAWNKAGYALMLVDARGSGASGGQRPVEWSDAEVADYGEVMQWVTQQPWSNQRIGTVGISYSGNTAELSLMPGHPALKAAAPLYNDFDPQFFLAMPGGVYNQGFIEQWNHFNQSLDANNVCGAENVSGFNCWLTKLYVPGVKPVAGANLQATLADHETLDLAQALAEVEYRDDGLTSGITIGSLSPYGRLATLEAHAVPMYVRTGWLDAATTDGALSRYLTSDVPQQLIIGAWSHGGYDDVDPFKPALTFPEPRSEQQLTSLIDFFDRMLKDDQQTIDKYIRYYTMNEGEWRETTQWPPAEVAPQRWFLNSEQQLTSATPQSSASDAYAVDFSATTGEKTRWHTNLNGGDVVYTNRITQDAKLLTYTSEPLTQGIRITGNPLLTLQLASTHTDGALHVYLEAVAPDGSVTYLTEGMLRLIHREASELPYVQTGAQQSFRSADARPLTPGLTEQHTIGLYATSVYIEAGYRLRIAIAGHDASMFARYPAEGDPTYTISFSPEQPSLLSLPVAQN